MFSHGKMISIDSNRYQQGSDSNIRTAFVIKREVGIQCDIITCRNCSSLRKTFLDEKTGKKLYPNDFIGEDEELDQDVSALEMISIRHIRSMCNSHEPLKDFTVALDTVSNKDLAENPKRSNDLIDGLNINTGQPYENSTATASNKDHPTEIPKRSNERKKSHLIDGLKIHTEQPYEDITATASNKDHPTKTRKGSNEGNKSHLIDGLEINTRQPYEDITATTSNEGHPTKTPKRSNEEKKSHLIDGLEINTGQLYDITATASNKDHPTKNSKRSNERNKSHLKDGLEINTGQPYEDITATTSNEGHPTKTPKRSNERNKSHLKYGLEINTGQPYEDVTATASNKDHPTKTPKKSNKRNKSHLIGGSKNNTGHPYEDITATTSNKGDEANGKMRNTRNLFININGPAKISLDTEKTNAPRERVSLKRSSAIDASSKEKGNSSVAGDEAHEKMRDARNYSINISGPAKTSLDTVKTKAPRERVSLKRSSDSRLAFDASSEEKGSSSVPVPVKKARKEKTIVDSPRRFSTRQKKTPTRRFSMVMEVLTNSMRSRKFVKNKILNTGNVNIQSPRYKATKKINPRKSFHGYEVEKQPFMNTSLGSSDRSRRLYSPTEWLNSEESMIFAAKRSSSSSE